MASLFNTRISDTYSGLIKTIDNAALTSSLKELTDGSGLASGVFMNTAGDFKVTAILEFGSLKDTGENIIISKFVDAADGIGNNDNDTTIPTTAAIIDYVAAQITIEDLDFTGDTGSGQIDLDSQIFAINGTTNEITTVASNQSITFSLDSTGVNLPDNSTAITQTAGDNSTKIATTSYVDTLDAASDLDFSGDSGTGDVNLNTQTFAITGTANQIESSASGQGLSLQFPSAGVTLPNGSVATTQSAGDNSTKVATTSYVDTLDAASDLDITDGTNTGDVNLNTQSLSILGTTNEIDSVVSGQSVTLGLPNQINVNVQGNLTGDVTGDVTGDLTGNSAGTHTGAVVGNVTGNVTGDVTGDLTGNADTATAWETARDLSLTGQATGTISSVDGTGNVSGAVTLDNNSVTSKVLTGLTSPSASSVLATDTIVEGFGKLQSQVNGLAGGLRFMGSWDADTNSPVLSSGGGEAANGTTTATTANKLVDSSASFTSTVTVGDQVVNQVDGQTALVSNVDSDTTLSLDADIMLTGEAYTIDNSPFITQGHYYVVSVGGTTTLNGISNWSVGDWVIAGANNQWTKLDHSQVDGTGTTGNLTKWSATQVIADSIVSESGTAITVDGSLTTNTNLSSTGNFAVNTDKFTVTAASGNTAFAGDLAINTDKFTVNATSGNIAAAGTGTFAGDVTVNKSGNTLLNIQSTNDNAIIKIDANLGGTGIGNNQDPYLQFASGNTIKANIHYDNTATDLIFQTNTNVTALTIDNSQNATFAGNVVIQATIPKLSFTDLQQDDWDIINDNGEFKFLCSTGSGVALQLNTNNNATFAGNIILGDTPQIQLGTNNDAQIDHTGSHLFIDNSVGNSYLRNTSTGSILLRNSTGGDIQFDNEFAGNILFNTSNIERMRIDSSGNVGIGTDLPSNGKLVIQESGTSIGSTIRLIGTNTTGSASQVSHITSYQPSGGSSQSAALDFKVRSASDAFATPSTVMTLLGSGNVGILTDSPDYPIDVNGVIRSKPLTQAANVSGKLILASDLNSVTQIGGIIGTISFTSDDSDAGPDFEVGKIEVVNVNQYGLRNDMTFTTRDQNTVSEKMRIQWDGNVGIGTDSNINAPLTVQSNGGGSAINLIGRNNGTADESIIDFYQNDGTTRMAYMLADDGNLDFATGGSTVRMRIRSGGGIINQYRAAINVGQTATAITSASSYGESLWYGKIILEI